MLSPVGASPRPKTETFEPAAVSRVFISHSSADDAEALAVRDWMIGSGWNEIFLDLDPERGLKGGQRWQDELRRAAERCEFVLFLLSPEWAASKWCIAEYLLTRSLGKRIFAAIVKPTPFADLPVELTGEWQVVDLTAPPCEVRFEALGLGETAPRIVAFSSEGLRRLHNGLTDAGLDPNYFEWPPRDDPERPPYRGLKSLEADDAGIFFGRDGSILAALDQIRSLAETGGGNLFVALGASGAGKSSFMRAGLLPRLARDARRCNVLDIVRPERAPITGDSGLIRALERAFVIARQPKSRPELRKLVDTGGEVVAQALRTLTLTLAEDARPRALVLPIDQAEELFAPEAREESEHFLTFLGDALRAKDLPIVALATIRSDSYERLQVARALEGVRHVTMSLPPLPRGAYAEVIKGPARRLARGGRPLRLGDELVEKVLADIEDGEAKDALPLLAFTLERLYLEFRSTGALTLAQYEEIGGLSGSIEAAVAEALQAASRDARLPADAAVRMDLLRRGFIPWLARLDPETGAARRRVASIDEIPAASRPLIPYLVDQRLLTADVDRESGATTIEPAHEALLRRWVQLRTWLQEDAALFAVVQGVQSAAREWAVKGRDPSWLAHEGGRLEMAADLDARPDMAAILSARDRDYLNACRDGERRRRRRARSAQAAIYALLASVIVGLIGWIEQDEIRSLGMRIAIERPYQAKNFTPFVLTANTERALASLAAFRECAKDCPQMVVIPEGRFAMGSPESEVGRTDDESPLHDVRFDHRFAVARYPVTFDDWDACVSVGACPTASASGFGRGPAPVVNVNWDEAQIYAAWLSRMTGRAYRLLSESEWEYADRAGSAQRFPFGDDETRLGDYAWYEANSGLRTHPVGTRKANAFGLFDMQGEVWEWVADCYAPNYADAPTDGSPRLGACPDHNRGARGGAFNNAPVQLRAARRGWFAADRRTQTLGFRVARTLSP